MINPKTETPIATTYDILITEYEQLFSYYKSEIASRRDYFKWYTTLSTGTSALTGYLIDKNAVWCGVAATGFLVMLGAGVLQVLVGITRSTCYAYERMSRIHDFFRRDSLIFGSVVPKIRLPYFHDSTKATPLVAALQIPLVIKLIVVYISAITVAFVWLFSRAIGLSVDRNLSIICCVLLFLFCIAAQREFVRRDLIKMGAMLFSVSGVGEKGQE